MISPEPQHKQDSPKEEITVAKCDAKKPAAKGVSNAAGFVKKNWHYIFLAFILFLFTMNTAAFISKDRSPLISESSTHLMYALDSLLSMGTMKFTQWYYFNNDYPPLVYILTGIFFKIFGISIQTALWSLFPFSLLFIVSVFLTGEHFGGKTGAVASMLIASSNVPFLNFSHLYALDVPQAALSSISFLFLLKSEFFSGKTCSYLFGIFLGFSLLCRFNSIFFMLGPLLILFCYLCFRSWKVFLLGNLIAASFSGLILCFLAPALKHMNRPDLLIKTVPSNFLAFLIFLTVMASLVYIVEKRLPLLPAASDKYPAGKILTGTKALLISLIISLPFYLWNLPLLMRKMAEHIQILNIPSAFRENLSNIHSFFPLIIFLTAAGIIFIFVRKKKIPDFILLISMGLSGYILTSIVAGGISRFLITEVMVLAVLGGYWIEYSRPFKLPLLAMIFAFSILPLCSFLFSPGIPLSFQEIVVQESKTPLFLDPVLPAYPDPDRFRIYQIAGEIKAKFENREESYKSSALYFYYSDDFMDMKKPMSDYLIDTYSMNLTRILQFRGIPVNIYQSGNVSPGYFFLENRDKPVLLIVGYENKTFPEEIAWQTKNLYNRKIEFVGKYGIMGKKAVAAYIAYP